MNRAFIPMHLISIPYEPGIYPFYMIRRMQVTVYGS
jgi:hypothetical protein